MSVEEIGAIEDLFERARTAKTAYDLHYELALEFSKLRRQTIRDLHKEAHVPLKDIAEELDITVVAASALSLKADESHATSPRWWTRVPDSVAERTKLGPGGIPISQIVAGKEIVDAMVTHMKTVTNGRSGITFTPAELTEAINKRLKREVPFGSVRAAFRSAIKQGYITHVGWGTYAITKTGLERAADRQRAR